MPNLLSIPFKKSYNVDIPEAARNYISNLGGAHPDEFRQDIKSWQDLRSDAINELVHETRVQSITSYHAQLLSILAKFPGDIQLPISYAPAFDPSAVPITLNDLNFERLSILFNLAALHSQLASFEDRSTAEGIKRAAGNYQQAAGTLRFLHTNAVSSFHRPLDEDDVPLDLSLDFVKALEWLMLAQAQECSWQLAKLSQYRNSLIGKIAAGTSHYYGMASTTIRGASPQIKHIFPSDWLAHIEAKQHHFVAVSEYRESITDFEASRYGLELARLVKSRAEAQKAFDAGKKGKITQTVLHDIQSLLDSVTKSENRAQRDNDLIYHQDVPAASAMPSIPITHPLPLSLPKGLQDPTSVLDNQHFLFGELVCWGAREAINIYNDRKRNLIQERLVEVTQQLEDQANEELRKQNLPSSLEALERPIGLPPSLLRKAEEIRLEDGPAKIQASIEDVERLAHQDLIILEEALDILDNEASEDEAARKSLPIDRLKSHEANVELTEKSKRYQSILTQASESDEHVRQKWDEWESRITELTMDEANLEASVPSSTALSSARPTPQGRQTRDHARALRAKLEELDALHREAGQLVRRARSRAASDDIQPRILKAASGFERLTTVTPEMFEDVLDDELAKFDTFLIEIREMKKRQTGLLEEIRSKNHKFLDSRRGDPIIKDRENALQSLDFAYSKYREITRNLDEGFKFYNELAGILVQFKEVCKTWSLHRNQELRDLSRGMQSLSLNDSAAKPYPQSEVKANSSDTEVQKIPSGEIPGLRKPISGKSSLGLPAFNSSEWEFEELPLPPPPPRKAT
ncbi:BRO1-like domain-containing protein [Crepidotus variabilis]|uniref:BRO1-like domain-containing protein n=1 Tax=Crepidotus variabilis TaxID=179855 RepID=A0A9P6EPM7_9AGAR|nr:BRO1-like domain-containing protein [Crepidotus variabilis]